MLTVNEIFCSIQGESTYAGCRCVFVRLTACDLRCRWCDTPYAFHEGRKMPIEQVLREIDRYDCPLVQITGGEPLLQEDVYGLMALLVDRGTTTLLETGGHLSLARVPRTVVKIMDVKCPGSGESARQDWHNIERLAPHDQVKFVIQDRGDYQYARAITERFDLVRRCAAVLFSPVHGVLEPRLLAEWMLEDRLAARLQLQLHKYIWNASARGV